MVLPMNKFLIFILFLMLSGCDSHLRDENKKLNAQVQELSKNIQDRTAEIAYFESQAGVARGCDFLISVCPASVVAVGRKAIQDGYGGATGFWFWLAFILKLAAGGAAIGVTAGTSIWIWFFAGKPEKTKADEARMAICQAQEKADLAVQLMKKAQAAEQTAAVGFRETTAQIRSAEAHLATIQQKILEEDENLETVRQAAEALKAFSS